MGLKNETAGPEETSSVQATPAAPAGKVSFGGVGASAPTPPNDTRADVPRGAAPTARGEARYRTTEAASPSPSRENGSIGECDPMAWQLPLVCKDCNRRFDVPYRHFQAGVVFHCPHCHGSFVPKRPMCTTVHAAFDEFFARRRAAREELARMTGQEAKWREQQAKDHAAFRANLERIADAMRPAGKMVRKGWLAGMFS